MQFKFVPPAYASHTNFTNTIVYLSHSAQQRIPTPYCAIAGREGSGTRTWSFGKIASLNRTIIAKMRRRVLLEVSFQVVNPLTDHRATRFETHPALVRITFAGGTVANQALLLQSDNINLPRAIKFKMHVNR